MAAQQPPDDPGGFEILYDRYFERIYRFVYARVRERSVTEDITTEVFSKALRNMGDVAVMRHGVGPWLYRIAEGAVADHYRRARG